MISRRPRQRRPWFLLAATMAATTAAPWLTGAAAFGQTAPPPMAPAPAASGKAAFEEGVKQYNLGHFPEAIVQFEGAYQIDPAPILLFNIAQSHRQQGNKDRALFFYRRYLEQAPDASNRAEVQQRMQDLARSLEQETELKQKPPTEVESAEAPVRRSRAPVVTTSAETAADLPGWQGKPWSVAVAAAPSFGSVSGHEVELPVMLALRLGGAYDFPIDGRSRVAVGVDGVLALLPYTATDDQETKATSTLTGFLVKGTYLRDVTRMIAVGGGVGAGIIWWTGLGDGNPFAPDVVISGAIPMPSFELQARLQANLGRGFFAVLAPTFLYSRTTSGLSVSQKALLRFDIDLGAGFRF